MKQEVMKEGTGVSASLTAIVSALATMSCCLPLGFGAAIGVAGVSAFVTEMKPWFLGLSMVLIGLGFWQQRRAKVCDVKGRRLGQVLLWTSVVVVGAMLFFPPEIAGF